MKTFLPLFYELRVFSYVYKSMWTGIVELWEVKRITFIVAVWIIEGFCIHAHSSVLNGNLQFF
jgi:hypothetical protein